VRCWFGFGCGCDGRWEWFVGGRVGIVGRIGEGRLCGFWDMEWNGAGSDE
jgi:hypothetical protein